jgi:hypothetical protein
VQALPPASRFQARAEDREQGGRQIAPAIHTDQGPVLLSTMSMPRRGFDYRANGAYFEMTDFWWGEFDQFPFGDGPELADELLSLNVG